MEILKVNEDNFEKQVLQTDTPTLVDFYADWCSHCRKISPILDELSEKEQLRIAKVDVDESPRLAQKYNVISIPALLLFKNGEVSEKRVGQVSKQDVLKMM